MRKDKWSEVVVKGQEKDSEYDEGVMPGPVCHCYSAKSNIGMDVQLT